MKCKFCKKIRHKNVIRCLRDGSIRKVKTCLSCPNQAPTLWQKIKDWLESW